MASRRRPLETGSGRVRTPEVRASFQVVLFLSADGSPLLTEVAKSATAHRGAAVIVVAPRAHFDGAQRPDHGVPIVPGRTYVADDLRGIGLRHQKFIKTRPGPHSSGTFLEGLAREFGRHVLAVVLSGNDVGLLPGFQKLIAAGARVIVRDPEESNVDALPRGIVGSLCATSVSPSVNLSTEVARHVSPKNEARSEADGSAALNPSPAEGQDEPYPVDPAREATFRRILMMLKNRFTVDLTHYKPSTIHRRIERRMSIEGSESLSEFADRLQASSEALRALHDELFVHVTHFFRDPESFRALRDGVFAPLLRASQPGATLRIWVPGCSTGEEAYSLAIGLSEFLEEQQASVGIQLFATDISDAAIQHARRGVYPSTALNGLPPERLERFFSKTDEGFKVTKALRDVCVFSRHDVTSHPPFARLDLISCRNVLIYFGPELQRRVFPVFHYALKPNGFLWLGQAELPGATSKLFAVVDPKHKICTKLPAPSTVSGATLGPVVDRRLLPESPRELPRVAPSTHKTADELILFRYGPPGVVIDHELEVNQFRGRTAPFIGPPAGKPTQHLLKLAHPDLVAPIRILIQAAKRENRSVRQERVPLVNGASHQLIAIEVSPLNPSAAPNERQYLVLFDDSAQPRPQPRSKRDARVRVSKAHHSSKKIIEELQDELDTLREHQQALVEQFESAQEELTSANEELQATNEEFQSTNEELETAKEELQAANEELISLNDELNGRNGELVAANERLARGEDRFRLLVESVKDYAIYMLDPEGRISSWNEGARRLKGYEASEILGQHYSRFFSDEDRAAHAPEAELEQARVDGRFDAAGWRIRKDGSRFWAGVVLTRIHDSRGRLLGFAKVTRDLTERRIAEEELARNERRSRLMISGVRDYAIFMLGPDGRVASWNDGARRLKGYEEREVLGKHFSAFYPPEDVANGKTERELATALAEGRVEDEGWRVRKDGTRFWANVVITRVTDTEGELLGFTKVTRDLTERRRAEDALRLANESLEVRVRERTEQLEQALRVRDDFLSIASHELKTPLTSLKIHLQLVKRALQTIQVPQVQAAADTVQRSLRQTVNLEELIEDLLDVSRLQSSRLELQRSEVNVASLVEEITARFAPQLMQAQMPLELDLDRTLTATWDSRRMGQVVANLIANAIKYASKAPLKVRVYTSAGRARVDVVDRGPGIAKEKQAAIFERFERGDAPQNVGGLGLGLFIAHRIVDAHGGSLRVESEMGHGATFTVETPLASTPGETTPHGRSPTPSAVVLS
ncbi:MAG: PAS domain S-box protein [Archangiaceae bacterium]|nr:PAS domain S-box protein [Archangiaceae bacterium]